MENKDLLTQVNPVFLTAKGCIGLLAQAGNRDAQALLPYIDMAALVAAQGMQTPPEIVRAYMVALEARFHYSNLAALESGCDVIVDLPCGYAPRALVAARAGKQYYGFDLPACIREIAPAMDKVATDEEKKYIHFAAVDATNYDSLRAALDGVKGTICIAVDGLLGYFTKPELESFVSNLHRLLDEFGGVWTTPDPYVHQTNRVVFSTVLQGGGADIVSAMTKGGSQMADTKTNGNAMSTGDPADSVKYLTAHGFAVETVNYADKLPELGSLGGDAAAMARLRRAYADIPQMVIRAAKPETAQKKAEKAFAVELRTSGDTLLCTIAGRLDTITAPELLEKFNGADRAGVTAITVDLADTAYISSAGLRVLLIMLKSLSDKSRFAVQNYSPALKEIFDVTGFSELFGLA